MPTFNYQCEVCGTCGREWRVEKPPRFCSQECQAIGMAGESRKKVKYIIDKQAHDIIRKAYLGSTNNGEIRDLAKRLNLPRWKISRYAMHQGWIAKQQKALPWSESELRLLKKNAMFGVETIQRKLKARGYKRTLQGILLKRKRMKLVTNIDGESASSLAMCLGEDVHFILIAIEKGDLIATRRETKRTEKQGGDTWFIKNKNIKIFLTENVHRIDLRKVDKYWFVDILSNNSAAKG